MNASVLLSIGSVDIVWDGQRLTYLAGMEIDGDGSGGNAENDPCWQKDTSLHLNSVALNARLDHFIVVPPQIIMAVAGVVLGCQAFVTNARNGIRSEAVVGDIGPGAKIGEGSIALAESLQIPSSPISGGISDRVIRYEIHPGVPAVVNGKQYQLQRFAS